jgi:hypothetical protein
MVCGVRAAADAQLSHSHRFHSPPTTNLPSHFAGYLFDRVKNKQVLLYAASLLAGATYFTFPAADGKYTVFAAQALIAGGTGALYTVQCSMVRVGGSGGWIKRGLS